MELGLTGKVALVAGASRGIGLAATRELLSEGCNVAITGRDADSLERARGELVEQFPDRSVLALEGDMRVPRDVERAVTRTVKEFGGLHHAVANVGSGRGPTESAVGLEVWRDFIDENLFSAVLVSEHAQPAMRDGGSIVFVGSIAGLEFHPAPLPYSVAKAALVRYTRDLARRLAPEGVRVNLVAPGNVLAPGGNWERRLNEQPDEVEALLQREVPMARFGAPEEIAAAIAFLCSERASFITGACLVADGGQYRG